MKTVQRVTRGMADLFASLELQFETLAPKLSVSRIGLQQSTPVLCSMLCLSERFVRDIPMKEHNLCVV